ncbi:phage portal protein [Hymenobacter convexus]|uniref:phage portal protein n=1 Tax=Hymenobacter sp. CA1UV-4 TaxID=3063782 RepID=UPI00271334CE|nr:phage portal protein [Hymenobacter sp. CA1UV-4]MDO7851390.1 phage portal protein [Hymenobacter sp. CA1UV-4]
MGLFDFLNRKSKPAPVTGDPNNVGGVGTFVGAGGQGEADPAFADFLASGGGTFAAPGTSGAVAVNEHTAVTLSAVWGCVRVIAESVAQLPLLVLDKSTHGKNRLATEHPAYLVLTLEPNPRQSAFNFWELMVATCCLWGNAYAIIERNNLYEAVGLHWVHPRNVSVYEYGGELWYWVAGEKAPRPASEILHLAGLGFNGVTGRSVLSVMRENFALGLSAQRYGVNFYENGTHIDGVLESANKIDDKPGPSGTSVLERLRAQFADRYSGLSNSHKPLILEYGLQYKRIGMPPADAQFIETRKIQAEEIARAFRVPQHKIGMLERSTNNNIEHQGLEFVTDCLGPWLRRIEQECRRKLLRDDQKRAYRIHFDLDGLLRGDFASRATFYKTLWGVGLMSANDIADMEDRDHVEGGDERFVPLNMVPTSLIKEVLLKPAAKAPKTPKSTEKDPSTA